MRRTSLVACLMILLTGCSLKYNGIQYDQKFDSIDQLLPEIYKYSEYVIDESTGVCYAMELPTEEPPNLKGYTEEQKLDKLISIVKNTEYTYDSSLLMKDGVNCQYMAVYVEKFCKQNGLTYSVSVDGSHVSTTVDTSTRSASIDFNTNTTITITEKEGES